MDYSLQHHASSIGSPASELPTPALTIRKQIIEDNIARLHQDVDNLNIAFRPHVKTLKVRGIHTNLSYMQRSFLRAFRKQCH